MSTPVVNFNERDYYTKDESDVRFISTSVPSPDAQKLGGHLPDYFAVANDTYTKSEVYNKNEVYNKSEVYDKSECDNKFLDINGIAVDSYKLGGLDSTAYALTEFTYTKDETDYLITTQLNLAPEVVQALEDFEQILGDSTSLVNVIISELATKADLIEVTPNAILTKLKSVDGSGSGLDADSVDGYHALKDSTGFDETIPIRKNDGSIDLGRKINLHSNSINSSPSIILDNSVSTTLNIVGADVNGLLVNGHKVWNAGNQGVGSGLDADKLQGLEPTEFARSNNTYTKAEVYNKGEVWNKSEVYHKDETYSRNETYSKIEAENRFVPYSENGINAAYLDGHDASYYCARYEFYDKSEMDNLLSNKVDVTDYSPEDILNYLKLADGAGSGLDADKLHGKPGTEYALKVDVYDITNTYNKSEVYNKTESDNRFVLQTSFNNLDADTLQGHPANYFAVKADTYTKTETYNKTETYSKTESDDLFMLKSAAGGGDADTLQGHPASYFAVASNTYNKSEVDAAVNSKVSTTELLNEIKQVDGVGSGLDADLIRGQIPGNQALNNQTISTNSPSGGSSGDIWYKL